MVCTPCVAFKLLTIKAELDGQALAMSADSSLAVMDTVGLVAGASESLLIEPRVMSGDAGLEPPAAGPEACSVTRAHEPTPPARAGAEEQSSEAGAAETGMAEPPDSKVEPETDFEATSAASWTTRLGQAVDEIWKIKRQPGPDAISNTAQLAPEPEPELVPSTSTRESGTVAGLIAQAPSAQHVNGLLKAYWEKYATSYNNRALEAFNGKPQNGVELAIADGLCVKDARSIAAFLLYAPILDKTQVRNLDASTHLSRRLHAITRPDEMHWLAPLGT